MLLKILIFVPDVGFDTLNTFLILTLIFSKKKVL